MTNKANSKLSFLRRKLKGCPEKLKQTAYFSLIRSFWSMAPLFGTRTKNTTVTKLRGCSVELQGSSKVGTRDTLVFLICLMCWGCCCSLPTPMTLASGGSPMFLLVVHQPASPSIWPAVQSLRRGLSINAGATMWCICGCS